LARYGFQAQPTPKDLSGILNANALYTFAIGFFQLALGVILLIETWSTTPLSDKVATIVPWLISFVSALLSIVNVIKDFSAMLVQMENEEELQRKIQVKNEMELRETKDGVEQDHKSKLREINEEFKREGNADDNKLAGIHASKQRALAEENFRYVASIKGAEDANLLILEVELTNYRDKIATVEQLLAGKTVQVKKGKIGGELARTQARQAQLDRLLSAIAERREAAMEELTTKVMQEEVDPDQYAEECARIGEKYDKMHEDTVKIFGDGAGTKDEPI